MIFISPARSNDRITLPIEGLGEVIKTIGTNRYGQACLELFEDSLDADHWALFHYHAKNSVNCIATASRVHVAAAQENINKFVVPCHKVDPSLTMLKQRYPELSCVIKIEIGDIRDRQYRHCFELTHVQERLSFFSRVGSGSAPAQHLSRPEETRFFIARIELFLHPCEAGVGDRFQAREDWQ